MNDSNNSLCNCSKQECKNCTTCAGGSRCCGLPSQQLIRGLLALFFGLLFVGFAYQIIARLVLFCLGAWLIYYGLRLLGITQVTDLVENFIERLKKLFSL